MRRVLTKIWDVTIHVAGSAIGIALRICIRHKIIFFHFASQALSIVPGSLGLLLRRAVYAKLLPAIGDDVLLDFGVLFEDQRTVIGKDVWISVGCFIDYSEIGDSVLIGRNSVLLAGGRNHRFNRLDVPIKQQGYLPREPLLIGLGAWIGANATVMADIGHDAIVGAGAVVTKPVPPYAIVAGNPARILRMRNNESLPGDLAAERLQRLKARG